MFTILGEPVPQGRPRFFRRGRFIGTYDPQKSQDFKQKVALFAKTAGVTLSDKAIKIRLDFWLPRPKSLYRKSDPEFGMFCSKRPDIDNLIKAVLDGLNGIAFKDDGQVCELQARKFYHSKGGMPATEISIEEIPE